MKNLITVMKFTIKDMVRKKSFIISTIIILALIIIGFSIPKILESVNKDKEKDRIIISDSQNIFEGNLEEIKQMDIGDYEISIENVEFDQVKQKIDNKEIESAIILEKENNKIKFRYIVENSRWVSGVPEKLFGTLNTMYSNIQISKLGLTEEELKMITPEIEPTIEQTNEEDVNQGNIFIMMAMCFALSMAIIFFTAQVSISITTEKTSKIMETLVTSTSPRTIVLGKTIGIGVIGLLQVILVIATAWISANTFLDQEMIKNIFDMTNISPYFVIITLVYFLLGYFAYALLYALTGSLVSKPEDIQSANTPVSIIAMIGFYLGYFSITVDPTSGINAFASIFPISSPFSMPSRVMMGLARGTDVAISIAVLVITVLIIAKVAIKVYSSAILNYGAKISLKDVFKMYKDN